MINLVFILFNIANIVLANDFSESEIQQFRMDALAEHNVFRARHGVPMLKLNREINKIAQDQANKYSKIDVIIKPVYNNQQLGTNKLKFKGTRLYTGKEFTDFFYAKEKEFDYTLESIQNKGGFTQVVWKNSREIGIGLVKNGNSFSIVALYYPPGNIVGAVLENVQKVRSQSYSPSRYKTSAPILTLVPMDYMETDTTAETDEYETTQETNDYEATEELEVTTKKILKTQPTQPSFTTRKNSKEIVQENQKVIYQINIGNLNLDDKSSLKDFNNKILPNLKEKLKLHSDKDVTQLQTRSKSYKATKTLIIE